MKVLVSDATEEQHKSNLKEAHADSSMQHYPHHFPVLLCGQLGIMHMDRAFKYLNLNGSDKEGTLVPSSVSIIWKTTNHIPSCFQIILQQCASHFTCTDHSMNLLRSQPWLCFYSDYTDVSTRQRVLSLTSTTAMTSHGQGNSHLSGLVKGESKSDVKKPELFWASISVTET